jgi:hypothetical protein
MCVQIVYSMKDLFSFQPLKCLQNDIVYREARTVPDDFLENFM